MSDEATSDRGAGQPGGAHPEAEAWKEVGRQFKALGESLAAAVHAAWGKEEVRHQAREMRDGLEDLVHEVGQAIKQTADSPEMKQATREAVEAGEHAMREARPHMVQALRRVNAELQTLIARMEAAEQKRKTE